LRQGDSSQPYIGKSLSSLGLPEGALVALVRRGTEVIIPKGALILAEGDILTIIGAPETIHEMQSVLLDIKT
jgi:Trk K+ transport system NAD-binding subunit